MLFCDRALTCIKLGTSHNLTMPGNMRYVLHAPPPHNHLNLGFMFQCHVFYDICFAYVSKIGHCYQKWQKRGQEGQLSPSHRVGGGANISFCPTQKSWNGPKDKLCMGLPKRPLSYRKGPEASEGVPWVYRRVLMSYQGPLSTRQCPLSAWWALWTSMLMCYAGNDHFKIKI